MIAPRIIVSFYGRNHAPLHQLQLILFTNYNLSKIKMKGDLILKKIIIFILIVLLISGAILGYSILKNKKQENIGITKINLNEVTRSVFYAPQYVAIANGYFKEENLEVELTTGQGADKVMTAVLAGQSDIGFARTRSCNLCI